MNIQVNPDAILWKTKQSGQSEESKIITAIQILLTIFWSMLLLLGIHNTYVYLYKMKKYSFAPMFLYYTSTLIVCVCYLDVAY